MGFFSFAFKDQTYTEFTVRENIIDMGMRTIAIHNISSVSVLRKRRADLAFAIIAISAIVFIFGLTSSSVIYIALGLIGGIAAFILPHEWFLTISTNDGVFNFFKGELRFLKEVKVKLDSVINGSRSEQSFHANFNIGRIDIDKIDTVNQIGDRVFRGYHDKEH